jgi:hypothetical protein
MPKVIPVPDAVSKPFWDAVNERRLDHVRQAPQLETSLVTYTT